ncbi:MAG: hypothetical protein Q8R28_09335, partial [Dehalococcoidia bacterium]|nr:hypothetical protein [Dehalococcoidia bacterium]
MGETHCLDCHQFLRPSTSLSIVKQVNLFPKRVACLACHMSQPQTKVTWPADAPMQFECGQCHKPHLSATPVVDCLSCHQGVRDLGLHAKTSHSQTTCQACHKPHEWKVQSRDNCLACHGDKVAHNAPTLCANCHDFHKTAPKPGST